jgi:hypothetical protein
MIKKLATYLSLTILSLPHPSYGCDKPQDITTYDFSGMVQTGETFSKPLSPDLAFLLNPNPYGWTMTIEDADQNDMIYPVTPPYRFNSLQSFDGSYGAKLVPDETRPFQFIYGLKKGEYETVQTHLNNILWPMAKDDQEDGLEALDHYPQGKGRIYIEDFKTTQPPPGTKDGTETVNMLKFKVHLEAPKGYFFKIAPKCD